MPEELAPSQLPHVDLEDEPLKTGAQSIEDAYALELVKKTFFQYETYRQQNHDSRWNGNDALYLGYIPTTCWSGTKIPKASLSQPIAFSQIEAALPIISQSLFPNPEWFQVEPEPNADPNESRAIRDHLIYLLDHDKDDLGRTARRELDLAVKSILMYGNGGLIVQWEPHKKKPSLEWVDVRDIFVDPGTPTPSIDDSKSVIWRKFYTVEELDAMRGTPGMNIPPREVLVHFSRRFLSANADRTKTMQEAFRGVNWVPGASDYSANPTDRGIEVLIYYSKSRIIWSIGREWIGFNGPNPYGFIPFCFAPCFTVLSRFYAMSYPDVLEGTQRYVEALYNARLNELSLSINPPRTKKLGGNQTPGQDRWAPGMVMQYNDPKNDMVVHYPDNATANIMGDIEFIMNSAQTITGINGMTQGVPGPGNVNRTATGVSAQSQGGNSRLFYIIKNIEDYLIVPMLYKLYKLIQFHVDIQDLLPALGQYQQYVQVGAKAFQTPVRFKMVAASQMLTREKLMQILPFLTQYYLNGSFIQQLHGAGKTIDFDEFQTALQDATGTGRMYRFIRPLTPQEQQQMSAPPPQMMMQQQQHQQELQTRLQLGQIKSQTEIQKAQIQKQPTEHEKLASQHDMMMDALQARRDQSAHQQDLVQNAQQAHQDMAIETAKAHQDMALKALEAKNRVAQSGLQLVHKQQSHAQNLVHRQQDHSASISQTTDKHELDMRAQAEKAALELKLRALIAQEQMQAPQQPPPSGE